LRDTEKKGWEGGGEITVLALVIADRMFPGNAHSSFWKRLAWNKVKYWDLKN
jgi:hypothetical protein